MNKNPKYDNDLVTLGDLKKLLSESGGDISSYIKDLPKSYSSPPVPPYSVGAILYYNHKVYRCTTARTQGSFDISDWEVVATDDSGLSNWVDYTYSVDKLQLQEQIDDKIETYYQSSDPNTWSTDIEKSKHVGDYWYNTTNDTQWRYCRFDTNPVTYGWQQVNVPQAIYDSIDSKKSIYTSKPTSYKQDDLWIIESTLSDDDLPIGTVENPIAKGDWVFATQDSNTYNKAHWVKRDTNITKEYIENHYYTTTEVDTIVEEIDRDTDSKITTAKDEIELSVSQTYTTQTTFNQKVLDYDTEIETITNTLTEHEDNIADLTVGVGNVSISVSNSYQEVMNKFDDYAQQSTVTAIQNSVNQIYTDTYTKTEINQKLTDGSVTKVQTVSGTFDENGMTYEKTGAPTKTTINEIGVRTTDQNNNTILFAGYVEDDNTEFSDFKGQTIVASENIQVKNYFVMPEAHSRIEKYENGGGMFYV